MCFLMRGKRVSLLRSSTGTTKHLFETLSTPPNTHWPSTACPRLYFRRPIFDSSISTTMPGPPICILCWNELKRTTSLQKLFQSTPVPLPKIMLSLIMRSRETFLSHINTNCKICHNDNCDFSKNVPFRRERLKSHFPAFLWASLYFRRHLKKFFSLFILY